MQASYFNYLLQPDTEGYRFILPIHFIHYLIVLLKLVTEVICFTRKGTDLSSTTAIAHHVKTNSA